LKDKSNLCLSNTQMQSLLKTSVLDLTSKGKDLRPFWNTQCLEVSKELWLPTKTDSEDLPQNSSSGLLSGMVDNSWFLTRNNIHQKMSLPKTYSQFCTSFPADCTGFEVIKTRLIRLYPTSNQKKTYKEWLDVSRYIYNQTLQYMGTCVNFNPSWFDVRKDLLKNLPDWCKSTPFQIKGWAVKEAHSAWWETRNKFRPNFRSRKTPIQSCYIPSSAIKNKGIYIRKSGDGLLYKEDLPEIVMDSRMVWRNNNWYLAVPTKEKLFPSSENQASAIVALDPGIRKFISYYSPHYSGHIGEDVSTYLYKYFLALDNLYSRIAKSTSNKKKKSYRRAAFRLRERIKNLITELHYKTSNFLCKNFNVIVLPKFETSEMSMKNKRRIGSKTVRTMMTLSFFKFRSRLEWIALKLGKTIVYVGEEYTSQTHPETGLLNKKLGGAKTIKLLDGSRADRDLVGARNILLKALVGDTPITSNNAQYAS